MPHAQNARELASTFVFIIFSAFQTSEFSYKPYFPYITLLNFLPKTTKLSIFVVSSDIQPPDGHIISESVSLILTTKSDSFNEDEDCNYTRCPVLVYIIWWHSRPIPNTGVGYCLFYSSLGFVRASW